MTNLQLLKEIMVWLFQIPETQFLFYIKRENKLLKIIKTEYKILILILIFILIIIIQIKSI